MPKDEYGICANCKTVVNVTRDRVCPGCQMPFQVHREAGWLESLLGWALLAAIAYGIYYFFFR